MSATYEYEGFLRQVLDTATPEQQPHYRLPEAGELVIGRDPATCQIVLDSQIFGGVSRRHASLQLIESADLSGDASPEDAGDSPSPMPIWQICDLNSANGTFINGKPLDGCVILQRGDSIVLSQNGPEFILEYRLLEPAAQPTPTLPGTVTNSQSPEGNLTLSQLLPIVSASSDLSLKAYLVPGVITVICVILLFMSAERPGMFRIIFGLYLGLAGYFFIYQLCGKRKPWWVLMGCTISTIILLLSPVLNAFVYVFRMLLPGGTPAPTENFPSQFVGYFFGAGLMEELLKAIPVLFLCLLGQRYRPSWRMRIGIAEPLDGILLAAAAALGFTLVETLGQYVPWVAQQVGSANGNQASQLASLQLLIPRILGSVAGHMAYSGYFGYFIGLSVLRPSKRWLILAVGWLTSAVIHALWNASAGTFGPLGLAFVGVLSYAFLAASILKARELSPSRGKNIPARSN